MDAAKHGVKPRKRPAGRPEELRFHRLVRLVLESRMPRQGAVQRLPASVVGLPTRLMVSREPQIALALCSSAVNSTGDLVRRAGDSRLCYDDETYVYGTCALPHLL